MDGFQNLWRILGNVLIFSLWDDETSCSLHCTQTRSTSHRSLSPRFEENEAKAEKRRLRKAEEDEREQKEQLKAAEAQKGKANPVCFLDIEARSGFLRARFYGCGVSWFETAVLINRSVNMLRAMESHECFEH